MTLQLQEQVLDQHADRVSGALQTLLLHGALEAMAREIAALRTREQASRRMIAAFHEQLRSAAAIQRDLLPKALPIVAGLEVHTLFRPAEALSGDLYDVFRIDETHVAFALADATGHGLPGGVLSTFISRSLSCCGTTAALQPAKALLQMNRDLLDAGFTDCPFVTVLYAVYHEPTHVLSWARGGAPYPILVRRGGHPQQVMSQGPLVGAIEEPQFEVTSLFLEPGDTFAFHTDGLEALVCDRIARHDARNFYDSEWFRRLGERPFNRQIEDLEARLANTDDSEWRRDDVTMIALQAN